MGLVFSPISKTLSKNCIEWFYKQFNHQISQSTVSESLSNHFAYLDQDSSASQTSLRDPFCQWAPNWPILEAILFDWQQLIERQGGIITDDILIEKACQIWPQVPQYSDLPIPEFSFKQCHNLQKWTQHKEASSANTAVEEMKAIQTLCGEYPEEAIYNMDETGLFWQRSPCAGLMAQSCPGIKKGAGLLL